MYSWWRFSERNKFEGGGMDARTEFEISQRSPKAGRAHHCKFSPHFKLKRLKKHLRRNSIKCSYLCPRFELQGLVKAWQMYRVNEALRA